MNTTHLVVCLVAAYLIGGIPFGFLIGKMRGVDVRLVGSKNIGATNVFRTVGKKWGLLAFACDVLKGLLPVLAAKAFVPVDHFSLFTFHFSLPLAVGLACIVGHMLTPYMKFKGGKGVATTLGVFLGASPALIGTAFLMFCIAFALTNYISLGSCVAALTMLIGVWLPVIGHPGDYVMGTLVSLLALFVIWKHRANIGRLAHGTENKIYLFRRAEEQASADIGEKRGVGMKTMSLLSAVLAAALVANAAELTVKVKPGEGWWGAATTFGLKAPFGLNATDAAFDLRRDNFANQTAPFMVSTKGRYVWSDAAFSCSYTNGVMTFAGEKPIELKETGGTLRGAFLAAAKRHFPASGKTPDLALVEKPQWNTWIELTYNQNQKDILAYAKAIKANGFPDGGVIMIDDTWQYGYGIWQFEPRRFPDPKAMCDELHALGYKVMLWVCPFVSMDSPGYRELNFGMRDAGVRCEKGGLVQTGKKTVYGQDFAQPVAWWNGVSAMLDLTHPLGVAWFARELGRLQTDYGVDGFKLDAGDVDEFQPPYVTHVPATPSELCEAYAKIGLKFPLNEYRACFKMAGQPLVQRLCDKGHDWESVRELVPDMINCGLLGHSFVCPDMIGGGSWVAFTPAAPTPFDPELFVRSAQTHALSPMMQFSAAPWRFLKGEHLDAVRAAAWTRMKFASYIVDLAKECAKTGEPMIRAMEYEFPGEGAEGVTDQFMLGSKLLVAPQTAKGAKTRKVFIPKGRWKADDGATVEGPKTIEVATPLARLPHFVPAE